MAVKDNKSDKSHATKKTSQSAKTTGSKRSDKNSEKNQRFRDQFITEKAVDEYKKNKNINDFERDYEYQSDEESIFGSFEQQ